MLKLYLAHFPHEPESATGFYEALGRNVVLWGRMEHIIDNTMLRILSHPDCKTKLPKEGMPASFKRKMQLWKRMFKNETFLAKHFPRALGFAADVSGLRHKRNDFIHAMIGRFEAGQNAGAKADRFTHKPEATYITEFRLLASELDKLQDETAKLLDYLYPIGLGVSAVLWNKRIEQDVPPAG